MSTSRMKLLQFVICLFLFSATLFPPWQAKAQYHASNTPYRAGKQPDAEVAFDVKDDYAYVPKLNEIYRLVETRKVGTDPGHLLHVLGKQRDLNKQPSRWLTINLTSGDDWATLYVRQDNLYLVGFSNRNGRFVCEGAVLPPLDLPTTNLSFGVDYGSLVKGGRANLADVDLGQKATRDAIKDLAEYGGVSSAPAAKVERRIKTALATMVVTFCEASRFTPIFKEITGKWKEGTTLSDGLIMYLVKWTTMSCAVLKTLQYDKNDWTEDHPVWEVIKPLVHKLQIPSRTDAVDKLRLLLWPKKDCDGVDDIINKNTLPASPAPLLAANTNSFTVIPFPIHRAVLLLPMSTIHVPLM